MYHEKWITRNWITQRGTQHQFINISMDCWHSLYRWSASIISFPSGCENLIRICKFLSFSRVEQIVDCISLGVHVYIYFRIHIGFRPALFLDRDSHWRERKKKGLIIFLQNTESLTDEKRSKRGWPIRVKKIEWRERFNRTDSITRMMSIGREARAIMMLAGRFIKHAIARYLEWLISGYRLSSFMLLIKIV